MKAQSFQEQIANAKITPFQGLKPNDLSELAWEAGKQWATVYGNKLPKEVEQNCFYYYVLDEEYEDISAKLNINLGQLVYTAMHNGWHIKKTALKSIKPGAKLNKASIASEDLIADTVIATAAVYRSKLAEVISDPSKAGECAIIPKNLKELQALVSLFQMMQPLNPKDKMQPTSVNVNIANVQAPQQQISVDRDQPLLLDEGEEIQEDSRLEVLRVLQKVRVM